MSLSTQTGVYRDCYDIWEAADRYKVGCRTLVGPRESDAEYLRARMHQARSLLRQQSRMAYRPGDPLYNTSPYDQYRCLIKMDEADQFWLYVELHGNWGAVGNIEPIPAEELGALPPELNLRLFHPTTPQPLELTHATGQDDLE